MHTVSHDAGNITQRRELLRLHGPFLNALIKNPEYTQKSSGFFDSKNLSPYRECSGLVDTGASSIVIERDMAEALGLRQTGRSKMRGVSGVADALEYAALIEVPQLDFQKIMPVQALRKGRLSLDLLLGRPFLQNFIMNYDGPTGMITFHQPTSNYGPHQSQEDHAQI